MNQQSIVTEGATETHAPGLPVELPVFYRINAHRLSYTECRWGARSLAMLAPLIWLVIRLFGKRLPASTDDLPIHSLEPFRVEGAAIHADIRKLFEGAEQQLMSLGFHSPVYHQIFDALHVTDSFLATFAHTSQPIVARVHMRVWALKTPPSAKLFTEFVTAYTDGGFLWTRSGSQDLLSPPSCRDVRRIDAQNPAELLKVHQQARAEEPSGRQRLPAATQDHALAIVNALHAEVRDFHLKRGVFSPLTHDDQAIWKGAVDRHQQKDSGPTQFPAVHVELDKLQQNKRGWRGPATMLLISIIIFIIIGFKGLSLFMVLALVPILFFHELGHFLAMKAFGYRDLRMFFIPGFGAMVTGKNYTVAGWKKVVVSLMGPLPGIVLGVVIGLCGLVWNSTLATQAGLLMLFINGFNLLPFLPLDGGHVLHNVLFQRHPLLDATFRVLAALSLGALTFVVDSRILLFLAGVMLFSIPGTLKVAKAARQLQAEGLKPTPEFQKVPVEVADRIIAKLQSGANRPLPSRALAQQTLQIYEAINTRPPGWAASIGLLMTHALGFAAAAIFAVLIIVAQQGGSFRNLLNAAAARPKHALVQTTAQSTPAPAMPLPLDASSTVVATYDTPEAATAAYQTAATSLKTGEQASVFGNHVFVRFPSTDDDARVRLIDQFQHPAEDVFVASKSLAANFRFQAAARSAADAQAISDELRDYFVLQLSEQLIAPWSSTPITPDHTRARKVLRRLSLEWSGVWQEPELDANRDELKKARRAGDNALVESLEAKQEGLWTSLRRKRVQAVAGEVSGDIEQTIVRKYLDLLDQSKPPLTDHGVAIAVAPLLGQEPPTAPATYALYGFATHSRTRIEIDFVAFADPARGAAALCDWLTARGCTSIHYEVTADPAYDDFEEESMPDE